MYTSRRMPEVADIATKVALGLLAASCFLGILAVVLPWWVGTQTVCNVCGEYTRIDSSITLWTLSESWQDRVNDHLTHTTDADWDDVCKLWDNTHSECERIGNIRVFSILAIIVAFFGAIAYWKALEVTPKLLSMGSLLGVLTGILCMISIAMGGAMSAGMTGSGVICEYSAMALAFLSAVAAMYAAGLCEKAGVGSGAARAAPEHAERSEAPREVGRRAARGYFPTRGRSAPAEREAPRFVDVEKASSPPMRPRAETKDTKGSRDKDAKPREAKTGTGAADRTTNNPRMGRLGKALRNGNPRALFKTMAPGVSKPPPAEPVGKPTGP